MALKLADDQMCYGCGSRNTAGLAVAEAKGRFVQVVK